MWQSHQTVDCWLSLRSILSFHSQGQAKQGKQLDLYPTMKTRNYLPSCLFIICIYFLFQNCTFTAGCNSIPYSIWAATISSTNPLFASIRQSKASVTRVSSNCAKDQFRRIIHYLPTAKTPQRCTSDFCSIFYKHKLILLVFT